VGAGTTEERDLQADMLRAKMEQVRSREAGGEEEGGGG
jgi:hypothetical protein